MILVILMLDVITHTALATTMMLVLLTLAILTPDVITLRKRIVTIIMHVPMIIVIHPVDVITRLLIATTMMLVLLTHAIQLWDVNMKNIPAMTIIHVPLTVVILTVDVNTLPRTVMITTYAHMIIAMEIVIMTK
jgi:hypothetical protein